MAAKRIPLDPAAPLRSLRVALGLTQEEAAQRCGMQRSAYSNAEIRGDSLSLKNLARMADALGREVRIAAVEGAEEEK